MPNPRLRAEVPDPRRRAAVAALTLLLAAAGTGLVSSSATAATATATATTSGAVSSLAAPRRLLTLAGRHALRRSATRTVIVAGRAGVPRSATAAVLTVTVTGGRGGRLTAGPAGAPSAAVTVAQFGARQAVTETAVVPLRRRAVALRNVSHAASTLSVAVTGYVRATAATSGGYVAVTPRRLLSARLGGHRARAFVVAGSGTPGIPSDASAVLLELSAGSSARAGSLTTYPYAAGTSGHPGTVAVAFGARRATTSLVTVPVGDARRAVVYDAGSATVPVQAVVVGYDRPGSAAASGAVQQLAPLRLLDTRHGVGAARRAVRAGGTLTLHTAGRGGVPLTGVRAVQLAITATGSRAGTLVVRSSGSGSAPAALSFAAHTTTSSFVLAPVDRDGAVTLRNSSHGTVELTADVEGFVRGSALHPPAVSTSHYVRDLGTLSGEGCADGGTGAAFTLLDIGAQTSSGVVLTNTSAPVTYAELDSAVEGYVSAFLGCFPSSSTVRPEISLATNNDGGYSDYTARGKDWAAEVVDPVQAKVGTKATVSGADDIESDFASTEAQAATWERAYLANTTGHLVFAGSLVACPDAYGATATVCNSYGWTLPQYVQLTYGISPHRIVDLPQVYFANHPDDAARWANLDRAAHGRLVFRGALTESGVNGYAGRDGWSALANALATVVAHPSLPVATNLIGS